MVLTLIVAGIAATLLLFGTAIPQLRGSITMARDLEFPDRVSVSITSDFNVAKPNLISYYHKNCACRFFVIDDHFYLRRVKV